METAVTRGVAPDTRSDTGVDRGLVARLCLFAVALGYAALGWVNGTQAIDHHIDLRTVALMRHGLGYYDAMNRAMREVGHGPVDEVRAFRMPTVFLVWRWLPDDRAIWILFVALVVLTATMTFRLTRFEFVAPALALVLFATAKLRTGSGWLDQFAVVELWVAPATVGALLAWKREKRALAAGLAFVAFAIRELAGGMLLVGLLVALRDRSARTHWIAACAAASFLYLGHGDLAGTYLVAHGRGVELPLVGTGGAGAVVAMMGFGLPLGVLVGPVLWSAAVYQCCKVGSYLALGLLAVPTSGMLISRPYWGLVSLPAVVIFGTEGVADLVTSLRPSWVRSRGRQPAAPSIRRLIPSSSARRP
jgi:hypothetical protein